MILLCSRTLAASSAAIASSAAGATGSTFTGSGDGAVSASAEALSAPQRTGRLKRPDILVSFSVQLQVARFLAAICRTDTAIFLMSLATADRGADARIEAPVSTHS